MDKRAVLEGLIDPNLLKIMKIFINGDDQKYYLRELAKKARVSPATTYRVLQLLLKLELVVESKVKKFKFYSMHESNADFLVDILADRKNAVQAFVDAVKSDPALELVVLHGREERSKANLLLIGGDLDQDLIREAALNIRETYGFNIIHLTLDPDQYNQMSSMGLYPGKKIILYGK